MLPSPEPRQLLFFVKAPVPGQVKTRLAAEIGAETATACYRRFVEYLIESVLGAAGRTWKTVVVFDPPPARGAMEGWLRPLAGTSLAFEPQVSGDLGDRLSSAFARAFDQGAESVLAVGSDCLEMTSEDVERAFGELEANDVVMGPAEDGGYWCIGLSAPHLAIFKGMPWSEDHLAEQTRRRARERGWKFVELRTLRDIDRRADLAGLPDALRREIGLPDLRG